MRNPTTSAELELISAEQAAVRLGIARRTLLDRVSAGTIKPAVKMPGRTGAFLFDRTYIETIAARDRAKALAASTKECDR